MSDGIAIATVIVIPRNKNYGRYIINEGSVHTMKYEALEKFLIGLLPEKSTQILRYLRTFRHFMIVVPEREIYEFTFDFESARKEKEREMKQKLKTRPPVREKDLSTKGLTDQLISDILHRVDKIRIAPKEKDHHGTSSTSEK